MTYLIHSFDQTEGWEVTKKSDNMEDFVKYDKWVFNHIQMTGCGWVEQGNRMWKIQTETK